jgi:hypothetical protein
LHRACDGARNVAGSTAAAQGASGSTVTAVPESETPARLAMTPSQTASTLTRILTTPAPPTLVPTNPTGSHTADTQPCPFAVHAYVEACAPGTLLSSGYRKACKHLGTHLCALRKQQVLSGEGQVPTDVVPAVHTAALVPALPRFCEPCCMLRRPMRMPRNRVTAVQPPPNWHELTPCGRRGGGTPARCAPALAPAAAATAEPPKVPALAPAAPPVLQHLPHPSIREIL